MVASIGGWWFGKRLLEVDREKRDELLHGQLTAHLSVARTFLPLLEPKPGTSCTLINGGAPGVRGRTLRLADRAQGSLLCLTKAGEINGSVLDVGCGTGENALFLDMRGFSVVGVGASPTAITRARAKANVRHQSIKFRVVNALDLGRLGRSFDTVFDSGLFHVFDDDQRAAYVASLRRVVEPGGSLHVLCFSEHEPRWGGPRRVRQEEIREAFGIGWKVRGIWEARYETTMDDLGARAWLATIDRIAQGDAAATGEAFAFAI